MELLASQGFPVFPELLDAAIGQQTAVCSFNLTRESRLFPPRHRTATSGQAGNTMNVNMIGASLVHQLGFTERLDTVLRRG